MTLSLTLVTLNIPCPTWSQFHFSLLLGIFLEGHFRHIIILEVSSLESSRKSKLRRSEWCLVCHLTLQFVVLSPWSYETFHPIPQKLEAPRFELCLSSSHSRTFPVGFPIFYHICPYYSYLHLFVIIFYSLASLLEVL